MLKIIKMYHTLDKIEKLCSITLLNITGFYIAELGTLTEPLGEGARAEKGEGKERQLKPLRRREGMQHVRTAYLFL